MPKFISYEDVSADLGAPLIDGDGARDHYRVGYFNCAREAATALQINKGKNRSAMPVLFLYRQYLELALKDALNASLAFDLQQSDQKFGHDLLALWDEAKRVLPMFVDKELLAALEGPIAEFHAADERADAFRYAVDRKGQAHFKGHGTVLLHKLVETMDMINGTIEAIISDIRIAERKLDTAISEAVAKDKL